jgi:hypothetical protein
MERCVGRVIAVGADLYTLTGGGEKCPTRTRINRGVEEFRRHEVGGSKFIGHTIPVYFAVARWLCAGYTTIILSKKLAILFDNGRNISRT